jgi:hypothetical protein
MLMALSSIVGLVESSAVNVLASRLDLEDGFGVDWDNFGHFDTDFEIWVAHTNEVAVEVSAAAQDTIYDVSELIESLVVLGY